MTTVGSTRTGNVYRSVCAGFLISAISACGGSSGTTSTTPANDAGFDLLGNIDDPNACGPGTQKQWAYNAMLDYYLFFDEVPTVNPLSKEYESETDLVERLRYQQRDPYSRVSDAAQSSLRFDAGREFGLGGGTRADANGRTRITLVMKDSPFGRAGVERGDIVIGLGDDLWADARRNENFFDRIIGTPENPSTANWKIQKNGTDTVLSLNLTATEYQINTVDTQAVFDNPNAQGGKIGYLAFNQFLDTSEAELNEAFVNFQDESINELILDLRYNGGGRVRIAEQLASLIAGNTLAGQTFYEYRYNRKYTAEDYSLQFKNSNINLGLSRVVVLTTENTASASELVIAGLQPYLNVVTIGSLTNGKPYISRGNDRCGKRLNLMEAEGFNADRNSVYGGIQAQCSGADDLTRNFGRNSQGQYEGMLQAGIDYIASGTCAATTTASISRSSNKSEQQPSVFFNLPGMIDGGALLD